MRIENILCPVDFSEFSVKAFTYATCLARRLRCRLFVQHTVHVPPSVYIGSAEPNSGWQALDASLMRAGVEMRRLAAVARLQLREVHLLVNEGDILGRLLQSIRQNKIDLVVMGGHERGLNSLAWRSLTARIIQDSGCPVLVVSRPQKDFVAPDELQPVELQTVLVATDFSAQSERRLAEAMWWAHQWSARMILLHVIPGDGAAAFSAYPDPRLVRQIGNASAFFDEQFGSGAAGRLEIACEVSRGDPKSRILEVAERVSADLIVMGNRGAGVTARPWGSTLSGAVRDARFPVLAVPLTAGHEDV